MQKRKNASELSIHITAKYSHYHAGFWHHLLITVLWRPLHLRQTFIIQSQLPQIYSSATRIHHFGRNSFGGFHESWLVTYRCRHGMAISNTVGLPICWIFLDHGDASPGQSNRLQLFKTRAAQRGGLPAVIKRKDGWILDGWEPEK